MKHKIFLFAVILGILGLKSIVTGQSNTRFSVAGSLGKDEMPIGAYYYPEQWSANQWERDLKHMSSLGFQFTHLAEFAWSKMEPEEGHFDFEWLDKILSIAQKNRLKVIMCTPTPTPPAWLTNKHPEILSVNSDLIRQEHGSRLHVIYDHPVYLNYTRKIVTELAKRYGNHEAVAGWQLDNEPHFGPIYDYSQFAEKQFPVWLKEQYLTIDSLNQSWGTSFWSQTYNSFEQIKLPNAARAAQGVNPHAMLSFQRFMSDRLASALRFQAELLREIISQKQWVTTNYAYFKFLPLTDPFKNKADLDYASHTMYLTSGFLNSEGGLLSHRLGSGLELSFSAELAGSVNGFTGIMELQPGQINWGVINPQPLPGAVRMWIWHAYALGDAFVCAYRFRQPLFGSEQTHKGIIDTDGVTLARGGKEYVQAIKEIKRIKPNSSTTNSTPDNRRKTAFLWDYDNINDIENHRHHQDFDPWQHAYDYYAALKSMGCPVTFLQRDDAFDPSIYPFLVVPAFQLASPELIQKWQDYVQNGGHLILSCRTAKKDMNGHLWEAPNQYPIYDLIGASVSEFDHLPANFPGKVVFNNEQFLWYRWGDWIKPGSMTEVLATYSDQFYANTPAVVHRQQGKGTVTYIGVWSNGGKLEKAVLNEVFQKAGVEVFDLPEYVFTGWRNGHRVFVNYSSQSFSLLLKPQNKIILGDMLLKPGGVTVVEMD